MNCFLCKAFSNQIAFYHFFRAFHKCLFSAMAESPPSLVSPISIHRPCHQSPRGYLFLLRHYIHHLTWTSLHLGTWPLPWDLSVSKLAALSDDTCFCPLLNLRERSHCVTFHDKFSYIKSVSCPLDKPYYHSKSVKSV